jgi:hypothetical protein
VKDAVEELGRILQEVGARPTYDPERSTAKPCMVCGTTDEPRDLVRIGTWTRCVGGHIPGDAITRPLCAECERLTRPSPDIDRFLEVGHAATVSGREDLPVADRIGLMRADLFTRPFIGVSPHVGRTECDTIHDLKLTIGRIRGTIEMFERAKARGVADADLERGANKVLSPIECLILAWRRGGYPEYKRVRALQQ